jgi:hypothetical protein
MIIGNSWSSYPSLYNLGHRILRNLLTVDLVVEEKVDGSQFSFGKFTVEPGYAEADSIEIDGKTWALKIRSRGAIMNFHTPPAMFRLAVETVIRLGEALTPDWTYRGEVLAKPKHNSLAYDRVPAGNVILFDVQTGDQEFLSYEDKAQEALRLGLEVVPRLYQGRITSLEEFRRFLASDSILGGQKVEGVVIKQVAPTLFCPDKKVLIGKFVSESFKEVHRQAWKDENPGQNDILSRLEGMFKTQARWQKAVIHGKEAGLVTGTPKDIGPLIRLVAPDVQTECEDEIKEALFKWAWPHLSRRLVIGFAEWYKEQLLQEQFESGSPEQEGNKQNADIPLNLPDNPGLEAK